MNVMKELKKLIHFLRFARTQFIISLLYGFLNMLCAFLVPLTAVYYAASIFIGGGSGQIIRGMTLLAVLISAHALFGFWDMYQVHEVAYTIIQHLRGAVYDAVHRAAPVLTRGNRTGKLNSIIMEDTETLEAFYAHTVSVYIDTGLCIVFFIITAFLFRQPVIAALISAASVLLMLTPCLLFRWGAALGRDIREKIAVANAETVDVIQGLREILIFNREAYYTAKVRKSTDELNKKEREDGLRKSVLGSFMYIIIGGTLTITVLHVYGRVSAGSMNLQGALVWLVFVAEALVPACKVCDITMDFTLVVSAAERINALLEAPAAVSFSSAYDPNLQLKPDIAFRNVSFQYTEGQPVLKNLSFSCSAGEHIALTGESGVGKTTIAQLLLRFYDCTEGEIYIGGKNIRHLAEKNLRDMIAYVPQDLYLFNCSIRENIRLARQDASDSEVEAAAKMAAAHSFISALPDGYDTIIGERGAKLSGGEKQRIGIARALLKNAPILIMDEAVSNLDTVSEQLFLQALANLRGKTIITIAHRQSTVKSADRIITL